MNQASTGGAHAGEMVLIFDLARQPYALPVTHVHEVLPLATLIGVPEAPTEFAGILRLRGTLLPVIDLRKRLGLPCSTPRIGHCIISARAGTALVGLLVDTVRGLFPIHGLPLKADGPTPQRLVHRTIETQNGVVMLLDSDAIANTELRVFFTGLLAGCAVPQLASEHHPIGYPGHARIDR